LRVGGFDMFARAPIAVAARADLVVETAVDPLENVSFCAKGRDGLGRRRRVLVLFRAEDGG